VTPVRPPGTRRSAADGLRVWDRDLACPGFTLFTPAAPQAIVYLLDLSGEVVHTWCMPYPALHGCLMHRGTLVYNGRIDGPGNTFVTANASKGGVLLEVDLAGEVLWEVRHPDHHHDGIRLANGNALLLCIAEIPRHIAQRVAGGREDGGSMYADYLVEMTTNGRCVWEWRSWDHLDPEQFPILNPDDARSEWTRCNNVVELPAGNLMLSFQSTITVVILDRHSGAVVRRIGPPLLSNPHAASLVPNGNILSVDNGTGPVPQPSSRVVEIDRNVGKIVWSYEKAPIADCGARISNAQRLWNGNTLITEGQDGRLFEVTACGAVVWEYINPHWFGPSETNVVTRAYRYPRMDLRK
jgi:outer membrane protein assembly factor BamB